jgi:glycerophosphoryl diester phosphodiesterase
LVYAHRGANRDALENTLPAFRRARELGADGVELDAWRCRSGEVVVFHDEDLRRLAGRPERVTDLSLGELRAVELEGGGRIPTLAEVLEEVGPFRVNIELKAPRALASRGLARAVASELLRTTAAARAIVSSFNPLTLLAFRLAAPRIAAGLLVHERQRLALREGWAARPLGCAAIHPEAVLVTAARVARWRRAGLAVNVWTVDDPAEAARLVALGVDGIITNDPLTIGACVRLP